MKKYLPILILLVCVITANAQWSVGPRVGLSFCNTTGKWSDNDDTKSKFITGLVAGAAANYEINETFSVNGELVYIPMGEKSDYTYDESARAMRATNVTIKERYNCMQMAILASALFGSPTLFYYPMFGLYGTFKFGGKMKQTVDGTTTVLKMKWGEGDSRDDCTYYIDPKYNRRFDLGMYVGAGVGKELGPGKLTFDFRFGYGFLDLNKFEDKDAKKQAKDNGYKGYHNLNFSLTFAYMYLLSK